MNRKTKVLQMEMCKKVCGNSVEAYTFKTLDFMELEMEQWVRAKVGRLEKTRDCQQ